MQAFEDAPVRAYSLTLCIWSVCTGLLLGPSLLVWIVRLTAIALRCAPGPAPCHGLALGGGLRDTLALSWILGANVFAALAIALLGAVAALAARRPLMASMGLLLLPIAAVLLPIEAVSASLYPGCQANEDGIGDCVLWGAHMGMSFHEAAMTTAGLSDTMPYCFALALMIGAVGFMFRRPKGS